MFEAAHDLPGARTHLPPPSDAAILPHLPTHLITALSYHISRHIFLHNIFTRSLRSSSRNSSLFHRLPLPLFLSFQFSLFSSPLFFFRLCFIHFLSPDAFCRRSVSLVSRRGTGHTPRCSCIPTSWYRLVGIHVTVLYLRTYQRAIQLSFMYVVAKEH